MSIDATALLAPRRASTSFEAGQRRPSLPARRVHLALDHVDAGAQARRAARRQGGAGPGQHVGRLVEAREQHQRLRDRERHGGALLGTHDALQPRQSLQGAHGLAQDDVGLRQRLAGDPQAAHVAAGPRDRVGAPRDAHRGARIVLPPRLRALDEAGEVHAP
jgi:hypothetical protein